MSTSFCLNNFGMTGSCGILVGTSALLFQLFLRWIFFRSLPTLYTFAFIQWYQTSQLYPLSFSLSTWSRLYYPGQKAFCSATFASSILLNFSLLLFFALLARSFLLLFFQYQYFSWFRKLAVFFSQKLIARLILQLSRISCPLLLPLLCCLFSIILSVTLSDAWFGVVKNFCVIVFTCLSIFSSFHFRNGFPQNLTLLTFSAVPRLHSLY